MGIFTLFHFPQTTRDRTNYCGSDEQRYFQCTFDTALPIPKQNKKLKPFKILMGFKTWTQNDAGYLRPEKTWMNFGEVEQS